MLEDDNVGTGGVYELDVGKLDIALDNGQLGTFRGTCINGGLTVDDLEHVDGCWACFADFRKPHLSLLDGKGDRRNNAT